MRINKIQIFENRTFIQNNKININNRTEVSNPISHYYNDFGLSFKGRTPEDFYVQTYNIEQMPSTMKEELNSNYAENRHVAPEQLMARSFRFLEIAENLEHAKEMYPEEELFQNLHNAKVKARTSILYEISAAKEMSDAPIFKDGTSDLGLYMLKKIFMEGKTVNEINKDFYEKDLNPEYVGIITQPINNSTPAAFGIKFPKHSFWHSFIATRDEYKKFIVAQPKKSKSELLDEFREKHSPKTTSGITKEKEVKTESPEKPAPRKYRTKHYKMKQIEQDIKDAKDGDVENAIVKSVRKRFSKDDPEASFIIKYQSPIMTEAAERIHLSEEEKFFAENEDEAAKMKGTFFSRFWKSTPELPAQYATAITDSIEMFEDVYGAGGMIPINSDYQVITPNTENKKAIDFVPEDFVKLLEHIQSIGPKRQARYDLHDKLQKEWEDHFLWRYGAPEEVEAPNEAEIVNEMGEEISDKLQGMLDEIKKLENMLNANNAKIYPINCINEETLNIVANLDETLEDYIRKEYEWFPENFIKSFYNRCKKHPIFTEDLKLNIALYSKYSPKIFDLLDDERIIREEEIAEKMNVILRTMVNDYRSAIMARTQVYGDLSSSPYKIYRCGLSNSLDGDCEEFVETFESNREKPEVQAKLNELYEKYRKPLSASETNKILITLIDYIRNFNAIRSNTIHSVLFQNTELISTIINLKDLVVSKNRDTVERMKNILAKGIKTIPSTRILLEKGASHEITNARLQYIIATIIPKTIFH